VLPGLILKGLAAVLPATLMNRLQLPAHGTSDSANSSNSSGSSRSSSGINLSLLHELRECAGEELSAAVAGPVFQSGRQDLPVQLQAAPPLYWPTERVSKAGWVLGLH
jgi:hypothetical protein